MSTARGGKVKFQLPENPQIAVTGNIMTKLPKHIKRAATDAKEGFDFEVLVERGAVVGAMDMCAASCALRRLDGVVNAYVMAYRTFLEFKDGTVLRYMTPQAITNFVDGFDGTNGYFPPGIYHLSPLKASQTTAARKKRDRSYVGAVKEEDRKIKFRERSAFSIR